ncbi:MAG: inorganic pyrophosphatase, partial [Proteobacteria bacterium]
MSLQSRAHPWHGVSPGKDAPKIVTAYIEIVPTDVMKYELDKDSGILRLDRPNKYSSQCPVLYGFIPKSYCGKKLGAYGGKESGRKAIEGDGDPLDICILSERPV